jgi:hypothetical protein
MSRSSRPGFVVLGHPQQTKKVMSEIGVREHLTIGKFYDNCHVLGSNYRFKLFPLSDKQYLGEMKVYNYLGNTSGL